MLSNISFPDAQAPLAQRLPIYKVLTFVEKLGFKIPNFTRAMRQQFSAWTGTRRFRDI
jgi:hypothetical protein